MAPLPSLTLSTWLRTVPLARQSPLYYVLQEGEFRRSTPGSSWDVFPAGMRILELSAGRNARWSSSVVAARPDLLLTAADLKAPRPVAGVECMPCDNRRLGELADQRPAQYDLLFASHAMCTCRCAGSPRAYLRARADAVAAPSSLRGDAGDSAAAAALTCGGLPLERSHVSAFVGAVGTLLVPGGLAVFDQEAGWSFGLETLLREAAYEHGLRLSVRRGYPRRGSNRRLCSLL